MVTQTANKLSEAIVYGGRVVRVGDKVHLLKFNQIKPSGSISAWMGMDSLHACFGKGPFTILAITRDEYGRPKLRLDGTICGVPQESLAENFS